MTIQAYVKAHKNAPASQRERLDIQALDRQLIAALMANFDQVLETGPTPQEETPPPPSG